MLRCGGGSPWDSTTCDMCVALLEEVISTSSLLHTYGVPSQSSFAQFEAPSSPPDPTLLFHFPRLFSRSVNFDGRHDTRIVPSGRHPRRRRRRRPTQSHSHHAIEDLLCAPDLLDSDWMEDGNRLKNGESRESWNKERERYESRASP